VISSLEQLRGFELPADWKPGEALATQQSEALRKMLLAVVSDVRLVLIRIAEQLYRLREAKSESPEVQRRLAVETREIYAALANRLGVWQLKWEMEDLAFRYLQPEDYKSIARALNEKRKEREDYIAAVIQSLSSELKAAGIHADISGRPKHIYSIYRKMKRKDRGLESLYDIRAVRLLVDDIQGCYTALGIVHNLWSYLPGEFDDYIANPKENDYQSLHTAVIGPGGKTVEIQIRTFDMHRQAELGVAAHWRYKEGGPAKQGFEQKIRFLRQLLEPGGDDGDLLEQIRDDVFEDRVYAISPRGDVVELPWNATPLDFAYHVHTQIGHRCRGAKVNGRIVPITYKVKNGDHIEIITAKNPNPSRDWLNPKLGYLASSKNRAKVRGWYRQLDREQHIRHGREILEREMSRLNIKDTSTDLIAETMKFKDTEALSVALGSGDLTGAAVATALQQMRGVGTEQQTFRTRKSLSRGSDSDTVAISGVGDLMSNFARCCRPVPPESIIGYITLGRGVSIHRADCGNALNLSQKHPERTIEVNWGHRDNAFYPVDLELTAFDRSGLIRDISTVLADESANVTDLTSHVDRATQQTTMQISIEIKDLPTLSTAITRLEALPNVTRVRRKQ
jgi:GTP pyrophosphokinase